MSIPVRIGNRPISFIERATVAAEVALSERDFPPATLEKVPGGIVAVSINGEKRLMALGRDPGDALFRLARLASAPEGRSF